MFSILPIVVRQFIVDFGYLQTGRLIKTNQNFSRSPRRLSNMCGQ